MASRSYGQHDPVTSAVELIAERWALLIVRDLLVGPRRYTDLKQGLPRIPTNILATRLKELQAGGVVRRIPILTRGPIYELTEHGRALEPVVLELARWGLGAMTDAEPDDEITADSLTMTLRAAFRGDAAGSLPPTSYELQVGEVTLRVGVDGHELRVDRIAPPLTPIGGVWPEGDPDLTLRADAGLYRVLSGETTPATALRSGAMAVVTGDRTLVERFAETFRVDEVRVQ